jgi:hypothetical protein
VVERRRPAERKVVLKIGRSSGLAAVDKEEQVGVFVDFFFSGVQIGRVRDKKLKRD